MVCDDDFGLSSGLICNVFSDYLDTHKEVVGLIQVNRDEYKIEIVRGIPISRRVTRNTKTTGWLFKSTCTESNESLELRAKQMYINYIKDNILKSSIYPRKIT